MLAIIITIINIINYYYITYHYSLIGFAYFSEIYLVLCLMLILNVFCCVLRIYYPSKWFSVVYIMEVVTSSIVFAFSIVLYYNIYLLESSDFLSSISLQFNDLRIEKLGIDLADKDSFIDSIWNKYYDSFRDYVYFRYGNVVPQSSIPSPFYEKLKSMTSRWEIDNAISCYFKNKKIEYDENHHTIWNSVIEFLKNPFVGIMGLFFIMLCLFVFGMEIWNLVEKKNTIFDAFSEFTKDTADDIAALNRKIDRKK